MAPKEHSKMQSFLLENEFLSLEVLNYGAIIKNLKLKISPHHTQNLVVGLDKPEQYLQDPWYLGACLGPYAGRIVQDHKTILHGGSQAFSKQYWVSKPDNSKTPSIELSHIFKSPENATVKIRVLYKLLQNSLEITYCAETNKECLLNLSNHSYFTLDQEAVPNDYMLHIQADFYTELDDKLLPTGQLKALKNTPLDFSKATLLGKNRLDTPFVLHQKKTQQHQKAASLYSEKSGIQMEVFTDQEVLVCFTPKDFSGFCFEAQGYPNATAHSNFTQPIISPEKPYTQRTSYMFSHKLLTPMPKL